MKTKTKGIKYGIKLAGVIMLAAVAALLPLLFMTACKGDSGEKTTFKVVTPDGAPYAAVLQMRHELSDINGNGLTFEIEPEETLATRFPGGADFIIAPTNLGAKMHNSHLSGGNPSLPGYKLAATVSWGVLHMVSNDSALSARDAYPAGEAGLEQFLAQFSGKEVQSIGATAIPGLSVKYIFAEKNVNINFVPVSSPALVNQSMAKGQTVTAVIAEPFISKSGITDKSRVLCSVSSVFGELTGYDFPMASLFVKAPVAESYEKSVDDFLAALKKSVDYLNTDAAGAGKWADEYKDSASIDSVTLPKALSRMNMRYESAADAKEDVKKLLGVIGEDAPDSLFL